jgi:hypothetical protein
MLHQVLYRGVEQVQPGIAQRVPGPTRLDTDLATAIAHSE